MTTTAKPRRYYTQRSGPNAARFDLEKLISLFGAAYKQLSAKGYWYEAFGFECIDDGHVEGTVGADVGNYIFLRTTRRALWPIEDWKALYDEGDVFDMIELLHEHTSKPLSGHSHRGCMHWTSFDAAAGQADFRSALTLVLEGYDSGYELSERGEIMELAPPGMGKLLKASLPTTNPDVMARLQRATDRFQRYRSSLDDRRHAVRELADILETLRPQVKAVLTRKDEDALFTIANNFGIRHANEKQQIDYDPAVWLSWMFYFYLSTIHACVHLIKRKEAPKT